MPRKPVVNIASLKIAETVLPPVSAPSAPPNPFDAAFAALPWDDDLGSTSRAVAVTVASAEEAASVKRLATRAAHALGRSPRFDVAQADNGTLVVKSWLVTRVTRKPKAG